MNNQYKGHALGGLTSADGDTFDIDNIDKVIEILMEIHCEDDPSYGEKAMTTAQRNAKCRLKKQVQDYMVDKSNRLFISLMVRAMSQLEEPTRILAKNRKLTAELRTLKKEYDEEAYVCSKEAREEIRKQEKDKLENDLKNMKDEVDRRRDRARKHQAQLIQYSEQIEAIRDHKIMTKKEWSDHLGERVELELKIVELKKSNKEYKDNVGTDPVLKRKYKKLKKLKKKLEKEIFDLKSKLESDSESDDAEGASDDEVSSSSETE